MLKALFPVTGVNVSVIESAFSPVTAQMSLTHVHSALLPTQEQLSVNATDI